MVDAEIVSDEAGIAGTSELAEGCSDTADCELAASDGAGYEVGAASDVGLAEYVEAAS
jgi:hypothetical protein